MQRPRFQSRLSVVALGLSITVAGAACGGDSSSATKQVASLDTVATAATGTDATATSTPADAQTALLAFAACMRENGVDMADPTFDADGNASGGLFGPDAGIDPGSTEFQTAQEACGDLMAGITLGGPGQGGGLDQDAIQTSLNDFTACLRDEGLEVDDIEFGQGQGPGGGGGFGGAPPDGSIPAGATPPGGSLPAGGFQGGPPADGAGPGGEGFDPTARIIERLGLDDTDPAATAAIEICQSILDGAFQPATTTTG